MKPARELSLRLITTIIALAIVLTCLWLGELFWLGLLWLTGMVAITELWRLDKASWHSLEGLVSIVALPALLLSFAWGWFEVGAALLVSTCLLATFARTQKSGALVFPLLLLPALLGGLMFAAYLGVAGGLNAGAIIFLWLLAVIAAADSGAFCCGRIIKGPRLAVKISPNKTWAGAIGAIGFGAVAGGLAGVECAKILQFTNPDIGVFAILGAVIAALSQGGDLYESFLKRRAGVKDSGNLLPGHGGILDRIDSLLVGMWLIVLIGLAREQPQSIGSFDSEAVARGVLSWM
ncbi:MAG: phosphatidate cytidylyltransferase [Hyphomicrobiales bacterium]|nr:phosphatidate cytidylyltransferase [Hyphomicrobiales bacterium]MCY4033471.1 phosphatidate cytidylyltransferase [Hyphomicrobiales bacterium]MCY4038687.1 phosphatidate cytidylyltransferase [Hyphomicrobiales bacterium]